MARETLSWCGREARRHDPERFLISLFVPSASRETAFALAAFNNELARVRESVSEPMLGAIRLQWWREAIAGLAADPTAGDTRKHPVLQALAAPVASGTLDPGGLAALVDARERDIEDVPVADMPAFDDYAASTGGAFAALLAGALGALDEAAVAAARAAGTAYARVGLLRTTPNLARQNRILLPADRLTAIGVSRADLLAGRAGKALAPLVLEIAARVSSDVASARARHDALPRDARAPLLFATLARRHLWRLACAGNDPWRLPPHAPSQALPLVWAAATGRY